MSSRPRRGGVFAIHGDGFADPPTALESHASLRDIPTLLHVNLDHALSMYCPRCRRSYADSARSLSVSLGPAQEGLQLIVVKPEATLDSVIDEVKRILVDDAMRRACGNQAEAARRLGMKYTTFHSLVKRLDAGELSPSA